MRRLTQVIGTFQKREEGHVQPFLATLLAVGGAIALAVGAAEDSSVATYIGGGVLAFGILANGILSHQMIDYAIFDRLDKLEK